MKVILRLIAVFSFVIVFQSCKTEEKVVFNAPKSITINKKLVLEMQEIPENSILKLFVDGEKVEKNQNLDISTYKLGKHLLELKAEKDGAVVASQKKAITFWRLINLKSFNVRLSILIHIMIKILPKVWNFIRTNCLKEQVSTNVQKF